MREASKYKGDFLQRAMGRGLLASTVLGWGILRERWWLGLILAVVVELPRVVKGRKDFRAADFSRAFTLSWILLGVVAFILWLQNVEGGGYEVIVEYLPCFFLPVLLCQLYGERVDYPVYVSTVFSNLRHRINQKKVVPEGEEWRMNFAYPFLFLVLIGASWNLDTLPRKAGFALLLSLVCWRLFFFHTSVISPWRRWRGQLLFILACTGAAGLGLGAMRFYRFLEAEQWINYLSVDSPAETTTSLGELGEIKQDPKIHWRIISPATAPPPLLRDRVFNYYMNRSWYHNPLGAETKDLDFQGFTDVPDKESFIRVPREPFNLSEVQQKVRTQYRIRGKGKQRTLLPVTDALLFMRNTSVEAVEYNSLGSVIGTNPITGVVDYSVYAGGGELSEGIEFPPSVEADLQVPEPLVETINAFLSTHGFTAGHSLTEVNRLLKEVFTREFTYTTLGKVQGIHPVNVFLRDVKEGHCEYFATAGCMLLRQLGYPARYVMGYVVKEYDARNDEWVLRGLNAHAWVRVWDEEQQRWINVDFTPSEHVSTQATASPYFQRLTDGVTRWREDFIVWRVDNSESWLFTILPWFLVVVLIGVFGRNLLKARDVQTPYSRIDRVLRPLQRSWRLPARGSGQTYEHWLEGGALEGTEREELLTVIEELLYSPRGDFPAFKKKVNDLRRQAKR